MHFIVETILNRPRSKVWKAFDHPDNMKLWQPTLVNFVHQSGKQGHEGAVSQLTYLENDKTIVLTETITLRDEPYEFCGTYESAHGTNIIKNQFDDIGPNQTMWRMEADFRFKGFLIKLLSPLFKGMVRKRLQADTARFKEKLESGQFHLG